MGKNIKITVITVCYNARNVIEETIHSVLNQTYDNLEYIIVDGASSDGTVELIQEYASNYGIKWISEPDHGIYDAMNKAVAMAGGDYLHFLNAGDIYTDERVIERVCEMLAKKDWDIVYGDILYKYPDGHINRRQYGGFCSCKFYYLLGDCINHQAMFAKRKCFEDNLFDLSYQICADREWMIRQKKKGAEFKALHMLICQYSLDDNSVSIRNKEKYDEEAKRCIRMHLQAGYPIFDLVNRIRNGKISASILHWFYKIFFIRKNRQNNER